MMKGEVNLSQLFFDPENPRLPKNLYKEKSEEKILDYMLRKGNIIELMQSIGESGYSDAEPLLIVEQRKPENTYIVVEGNRRLAALKLLYDPTGAKVRRETVQDTAAAAKIKPTSIPVIIYKQREQILDYLGYRHITGVKDWGPLEKARYLFQLYNRHISETKEPDIFSVLAKMIGSTPEYVTRLFVSLQLFEIANDNAFFDAKVSDEKIEFSWFPTILSYKGTITYLNLRTDGQLSVKNLDLEKYKNLFCWMFDPNKKVVAESRELHDLNLVVSNPIALEKLSSGARLSEAILYTEGPATAFSKMLEKAKTNLQSSKNMIEQLSALPDGAIERIVEIEKTCKSIRGALEKNFIEARTDKAEIDRIALTPEFIDSIVKAMKDKDGNK